MLFKRSTNGKIVQTELLKLWIPCAVLIVLAMIGMTYRMIEWHDRTEKCEANGGFWIGGAMPASYCAIPKETGEWEQ